MTKHKNQLITDIRKKFSQLSENMKLAEKKVYEDLAKSFKTINGRVSELLKAEIEAGR